MIRTRVITATTWCTDQLYYSGTCFAFPTRAYHSMFATHTLIRRILMAHNFYTKTHTLSSGRLQITLKGDGRKMPYTTLGIHEHMILRTCFSVRLEIPEQLALSVSWKELRVVRGVLPKGPVQFFSRISRRWRNIDFLHNNKRMELLSSLLSVSSAKVKPARWYSATSERIVPLCSGRDWASDPTELGRWNNPVNGDHRRTPTSS